MGKPINPMGFLVREYLGKGLSFAEIAAETGLTKQQVAHFASHRWTGIANGAAPPERYEKMRELVRQGVPRREIAARFGVSIHTVVSHTHQAVVEGVVDAARPAPPPPEPVVIPSASDILAELSPAQAVAFHRECAKMKLTPAQYIAMMIRRAVEE